MKIRINHLPQKAKENSLNEVRLLASLSSPYITRYYEAFFDEKIEGMTTVNSPVTEVTNYMYEQRLQDDRRNIFLLKRRFLNVVKDDLEEIMAYKKGSTQYKSETLKTADNIRLFT